MSDCAPHYRESAIPRSERVEHSASNLFVVRLRRRFNPLWTGPSTGRILCRREVGDLGGLKMCCSLCASSERIVPKRMSSAPRICFAFADPEVYLTVSVDIAVALGTRHALWLVSGQSRHDSVISFRSRQRVFTQELILPI